ncbi:hypothetical protein MPSEU_001053900 [Mayamaea pseudoterrestris]|nr:hypothetical protein MPSEU_001053900 [Mayamaea pseudoterrestris]
MSGNKANKQSLETSVEQVPLVRLNGSSSSRRWSLALRSTCKTIGPLVVIIVLLLALFTEKEEHQVEFGSTRVKNETLLYETRETGTLLTIPVTSGIDIDDPFAYLNQHQVILSLSKQAFDVPSLQANLRQAKQQFHDRLEAEYGTQAAQEMFLSRNLTFASPLNRSRHRMVRKLQTKLLKVQLRAKDDDERRRQLHQRSDEQSLSNMRQNRHLQDGSDTMMVPFIWATGGHSAAAGHGNYFNESYTARLEQLLAPVFASMGMRFVGRNYAMGGTSSGLEIGACVDQIFGLDIDMLSWDYGMTDGSNFGIFENYFAHAAIHPNRPGMVALNAVGRRGQARLDVMQHLEEHGMPVLYLNEETVNQVGDLLPDSFGKTEEELQAMGPLSRNMKCQGQMEVGDPFCGLERWSPMCPERKYKVKWHPGWKYHAMYGTIMALSLFDILDAAVQGLVDRGSYEPGDLLKTLTVEEDEDYKTFQQSEMTVHAKEGIVSDPSIDMNLVVRKRPWCRTARLPAQSRYLGIMTERADKMTSYIDYDVGMQVDEARNTSDSDGIMRLVFEESHGARDCVVPLNQDFKDYYLISSTDGWQSITFPNDRELKYYDNGEPRKGLVMIALASCGWRCPEGDVREDGFATGAIEMEINGLKVTNTTTASAATFLKHGADGGNAYFPPSSQGRYEIRARVSGDGAYMRLSTIVVW